MKKNINQSGFGAIELIIILVVLIALGGGGYYVWHKNHNKPSTDSSTATPTQSSDNASASVSGNTTSTSVVATTLGKAPQDLQTAVINRLKSANCLAANNQAGSSSSILAPETLAGLDSSPIYYMANSGAAFNACDALSIYSYTSGQWQYIAGTQMIFECTTLQQHNFPSAVLNAEAKTSTTQCLDSSGNPTTYTAN